MINYKLCVIGIIVSVPKNFFTRGAVEARFDRRWVQIGGAEVYNVTCAFAVGARLS